MPIQHVVPHPTSGWALRERGAPDPVNTTDLFSVAYDRIKVKAWLLPNISDAYGIRDHTYVIVPGALSGKQYLAPIQNALAQYGVPAQQIVVAHMDYRRPTLDNAKILFNTVNSTFDKFKQQDIVVITHSNGVIPIHAMYALFNQSIPMIHGVIAYQPIWGGSDIVADPGLKLAANQIFHGAASLTDLSYKSRHEFVRLYPVPYNRFRMLTVSTHTNKPSAPFAATTFGLKKTAGLNDGVVPLVDQLVPGARAIIVENADHAALVFPSTAKCAWDSTLFAQATLYTLFKQTP